MAKLTKNENVTCEVICNLCRLLNCQPGDIMEYKNN
nr:MAG TPA: putative transcriptional regulator [Bacteriophage sp.]DAX05429.1 MAG TPA: putative transcriptional regulator [Bacteriophage sp.]